MLLQHLAGCLASFSTVQDEEDGGEDGGAAPAAGAAARAARGSPAPPSRARGRSAGYQLRELDLENYIFESIPGVPELAALQENFYPFYVFTAVRKMVVLLDPTKTGRIAVRDLVASRVFADWMKMLPNGHPDLGPPGAAIPPRTSSHSRDPVLCAERIVAESWNPPPPAPTNWFSAANALRVYSQYLKLDVDQNGMLSPAELAAYRGGILTSACIGRIFAECHTYEGEIDFKGYLDVILALENRTSAASQRYLFRLLDVNHTGRVGLQELRGFCREVVDKLVASGQEPVDVANVCDEIFDMVHPRQPGYLTLDDILRCKVGHTACSIPLDAAAFFAYDRREELKGDGTEGQPEADSDFESA
jgi:serine/threonine-protein phosphatase 2A regulatory subunit B''